MSQEELIVIFERLILAFQWFIVFHTMVHHFPWEESTKHYTVYIKMIVLLIKLNGRNSSISPRSDQRV